MPEAFQEAEALRLELTRLRPEWMSPSPDLRVWRHLKADWGGPWWRRARRTPHREAALIEALGTGRRQRFCSGACRAKFSRERTRLHQLLRRLGDTRGLDAPIPSEDIESLESQIDWLLGAYGGVDEELLREGIFTPRFPSDDFIEDWCRRRREADDRAREILLSHAGD